MNQMLPTAAFEQEVAAPLQPKLTRHEKLMHFAAIVRKSGMHFRIFSSLERYSPDQWDHMSIEGSAFALAAADPKFIEAGLSSDTVGAAKRFFELSREDLHGFSCDCGGAISNDSMADRIEATANRR